MYLKKLTLFFFLSYSSLLPSDFLNSGFWFSDKKEFRNGFEFLQVVLQKNTFILAKLSYNEEKKWEEIRLLGKVEEGKEKGTFRFKPEMCAVYAAKKLGLRWILIQGFDCDHLDIQMTRNEQGIFISPSIGITEITTLRQESSKLENSIQGIIVFEEGEKFQAWGLGMKYIKKASTAFLKNRPITVLETVDSTGAFESKEQFKIGDKILIQNRVKSDLFD